MTYILEDQVFIIIMILYADDKSTVCCFGLVLDSFVKTGDRKVPILVGPLYHFNCRMEMSNSSNYSYDIILQFSLSAFVSLKKKMLHRICQQVSGLFPSQTERRHRLKYYIHTVATPVGGVGACPTQVIHRVQATPCSPTSKFNDTKSTYLRQFHTADSQVCISILFHECKYFTNCHCFPGTMCAFIAKYKPCYRPLPQNI